MVELTERAQRLPIANRRPIPYDANMEIVYDYWFQIYWESYRVMSCKFIEIIAKRNSFNSDMLLSTVLYVIYGKLSERVCDVGMQFVFELW